VDRARDDPSFSAAVVRAQVNDECPFMQRFESLRRGAPRFDARPRLCQEFVDVPAGRAIVGRPIRSAQCVRATHIPLAAVRPDTITIAAPDPAASATNPARSAPMTKPKSRQKR
jgi:hypothetical protein